MEYNGLAATSGNTYGYGLAYTDAVTGAAKLTLVAGTKEGTFAFLTEDGKYLAAVGNQNKFTAKTTLDDYCSWTITFNYWGDVIITNVGDTSRVIQWNTNHPRFAPYTGTQQNIQLYVYD